MRNKKLLLPTAALAILTLGAFGSNLAIADDSDDPRTTIVQKIAEKFGLNEEEVKAVFDEVRDEHMAEMQTKQEERLNQLVTDGKITEEQKTLIQNKQEELKSSREENRESAKDLTQDERRAKMEEERAEVEAWANENDIEMEYLFQGKGHGERGDHAPPYKM